MNVEDIVKENSEISGKKLESMSKSQLGVVLDDFVLKDQRQAINKNFKVTWRRQHKRQIRRKRGKYKDDQEGRPTFIINNAAAVREVCVIKGGRERER